MRTFEVFLRTFASTYFRLRKENFLRTFTSTLSAQQLYCECATERLQRYRQLLGERRNFSTVTFQLFTVRLPSTFGEGTQVANVKVTP